MSNFKKRHDDYEVEQEIIMAEIERRILATLQSLKNAVNVRELYAEYADKQCRLQCGVFGNQDTYAFVSLNDGKDACEDSQLEVLRDMVRREFGIDLLALPWQ